ncbi:MAG: ATP-dependent helicase HrpB [Verrucomicrobiota bacterium]
MTLPIFDLEEKIVSALQKENRLILQAPTGSGKSTQVPQMLLDQGLAGDGQIVILQPRRLPARMLAKRVAEERKCKLGEEVGYQIRFDDISSQKTRIKFLTEGILLRQILSNPRLDEISVLIFDEFHERHLYSDISLARAFEIQKKLRPDLNIIVMSATLDANLLQNYLHPCEVLRSEGRTYPVDIEYLSKEPETPWDAAADALEKLLNKNTEGDALIFMPGAYEIQKTIQAIQNSDASKNTIILPLHGELAVDAQDAAVARYDKRKIIVSTNVAETSLTIDGVRIVIDSGLAKIPRYDPHRGINTLLIEKISQASAEQRAGRAGRTAPGICVRLWTQKDHALRPAQLLPEIQRLDLSEAVLTLKASGFLNLQTFPWLENPLPLSLEKAETLLRDMGALDEKIGEITDVGRAMLKYPIHPRYARMLLAASEMKCIRPVALIAALTQERNLLMRAQDRRVTQNREDLWGHEEQSDFFVLMRAWQGAANRNFDFHYCRSLGIHAQTARRVAQNFQQFLRIAGVKEDDKEIASSEKIQKCILLGFADHLAARCDGGTLRCRLVHGRAGTLKRESAVQNSSLFVASEIEEIHTRNRDVQVLLSLATSVSENWLKEFFPDDFHESEEVIFDETARRIVARRERRFRDLVLESKDKDAVPSAKTAALFADAVENGICPLKNWNAEVEQWIVRLNCLAQWRPEWELPPISPADRRFLIEQICQNAISYKDIKDHPVWNVVKNWLSPQQQSILDQYAPERFILPNSRKAKITYAENASPVLSAKIQDLYDVKSSLFVADGKVPLTLEILAPNFRPIQITQNLENFWRETYPQLKPQLQRRYPKHKWI